MYQLPLLGVEGLPDEAEKEEKSIEGRDGNCSSLFMFRPERLLAGLHFSTSYDLNLSFAVAKATFIDVGDRTLVGDDVSAANSSESL